VPSLAMMGRERSTRGLIESRRSPLAPSYESFDLRNLSFQESVRSWQVAVWRGSVCPVQSCIYTDSPERFLYHPCWVHRTPRTCTGLQPAGQVPTVNLEAFLRGGSRSRVLCSAADLAVLNRLIRWSTTLRILGSLGLAISSPSPSCSVPLFRVIVWLE
jgi:hypothetical protein